MTELATWHEENQRLLTAEVTRVRRLLEAHAGDGDAGSAETGAAPALDFVCRSFGLSPSIFT